MSSAITSKNVTEFLNDSLTEIAARVMRHHFTPVASLLKIAIPNCDKHYKLHGLGIILRENTNMCDHHEKKQREYDICRLCYKWIGERVDACKCYESGEYESLFDLEITREITSNPCSNGCLHLLWKSVNPSQQYPMILCNNTWEYMWLVERLAVIIHPEDFTIAMRHIALDCGLLVEVAGCTQDSVVRVAGSRALLKDFVKYLKPLFEATFSDNDYSDDDDDNNDNNDHDYGDIDFFENVIMNKTDYLCTTTLNLWCGLWHCIIEVCSVPSCTRDMTYLNDNMIRVECYNPLTQLPNFNNGNISKLPPIPDKFYEESFASLSMKFNRISSIFDKHPVFCQPSPRRRQNSNAVIKKINKVYRGSIGGILALDTVPKILRYWGYDNHKALPSALIEYIMKFVPSGNMVRSACDMCKSPCARQLALITKCCGKYKCIECVVSDLDWNNEITLVNCIYNQCNDCAIAKWLV
jgi:hypothetical protein